MRFIIVIVVAVIAGYAAGLVLSTWLGDISAVMFERALWVRYLPLILALVCGGLAFSLERRRWESNEK